VAVHEHTHWVWVLLLEGATGSWVAVGCSVHTAAVEAFAGERNQTSVKSSEEMSNGEYGPDSYTAVVVVGDMHNPAAEVGPGDNHRMLVAADCEAKS
jgi:hypothetical protein